MATSATQLDRALAIEGAAKEVERKHAKRRISFGVRHSGSPKGIEQSDDLRRVLAGFPVLVFVTATKSWQGPFSFIEIDDETVIQQLPGGRRIFRSTCVRSWTKSGLSSTVSNVPTDETMQALVTNAHKMDTKTFFPSSQRQELEGLIQNDTFKPIRKDDIANGTRIFVSRFIDALKKVVQDKQKKSCLVSQNYADHGATQLVTRAATVQRFSERLIASPATSLTDLTAITRDVTQSYIQSKTLLERNVYIRATE